MRQSGCSSIRAFVVSMPLIPGIAMSMITTSGWHLVKQLMASLPSPASPTTSISGVTSSMALRPARRMAWSSTSMTRILSLSTIGRVSVVGNCKLDAGTLARCCADLEVAPDQGRSLLHPQQAKVIRACAVCGHDLRVETTAIVLDGDHGAIFFVVHANARL